MAYSLLVINFMLPHVWFVFDICVRTHTELLWENSGELTQADEINKQLHCLTRNIWTSLVSL